MNDLHTRFTVPALCTSAICLVALVSACGDAGTTAPSGSASASKPTMAASAKASSSAAMKPSTTTALPDGSGMAPPGSATAAASGSAGPVTEGGKFPPELDKFIAAVKDPAPLEDEKLKGFFFAAPKGAKLTTVPVPGEWSQITVAEGVLSFFAFDPEDGGTNCTPVKDMKAKVKDAKTIADVSAKPAPWGRESIGDEVQLWTYEKDGKAGFYGLKNFKGPKGTVTYCCAPGDGAQAKDLKLTVDKDKADVLAGICMSLKQKL